jgi:hypothetical protein
VSLKICCKNSGSYSEEREALKQVSRSQLSNCVLC